MTRLLKNEEQGATVIMVATMMLLLLGMAALVIDIGFAMNERRQDQTAADVSVMAGALELAGTQAQIIAQVKDYATDNVDATITDADWLACTNPQMDSHGPDFTALSDGLGSYPCISAANNGYLQVRIPRQTIDTTFGRVLGINQLSTDAFAIAQVAPDEGGGILPFGLTSTAGPGLNCLRTGPPGSAVFPCDVAPYIQDSGNFFIIDSRLFGNDDLGTTQDCTNGGAKARYGSNLAIGLDHFVSIHGSNPLNPDLCSAILPPNQLYIQKGNGMDPDAGLISGTFGAFNTRGLLRQGPNPKRKVFDKGIAYNLDNRPLWDYLVGGTGNCSRGYYTGLTDQKQIQLDLAACLSTGSPQFDASIKYSPRLAQVPQFEEPNWPGTGNGLATIADFEAVFLHGVFFDCTGSLPCPGGIFFPGESTADFCHSNGCSKQIKITQLTSFFLPKTSLPAGTFPNKGPNGTLNVSEARLWR